MPESISYTDESILVKELSKGNLLVFNALFKKYSGKLYRFAYGYLKSESEAEELVQEVFTIIWEKREGLKHELSFKSYLFTIAFNIIKKHFRTRAYMSDYMTSGVGSELDTQTFDKITYDSLHKYLNEIVDKLPARRREVFIKSRFEGMTIKEISTELNISHKTVENHLTDALRYIRANLQKENLFLGLFLFLFIY
jgi:RNA polymerase sigma-70 factor (family 1)